MGEGGKERERGERGWREEEREGEGEEREEGGKEEKREGRGSCVGPTAETQQKSKF